MRRSSLAAASLVLSATIIAACSDKPLPTSPVSGDALSLTISKDGCVDQPIGTTGTDPVGWFNQTDPRVQNLINTLWGTHTQNKQSALSTWENLKKDKLEGKPVQSHIDNFGRFTINQYTGGFLTDPGLTLAPAEGGLTLTTGVVRLLDLVFTCVGMVPTSLPEPPEGFNAAFELVEPSTQSQQFTTSGGDAVTFVPSADEFGETALEAKTMLVMVKQPETVRVNTPFPTLSNVVDVALAGGKLRANRKLSVLFCPLSELSAEVSDRAVVAHQLTPAAPGAPVGEGVEYLDPPQGGTLECSEVPHTHASSGFFRKSLMQVASVAKKAWSFVGPKTLYAGHAAIGGSVGGFLSPMVVVDPFVQTEVVFTNEAGVEVTPVDGNLTLPATPTYGDNTPVRARLRIRNITANPAVYRGQWVSPDAVTGLVNKTQVGNANLAMAADIDAGTPTSALTDGESFASWSFPCLSAGPHIATVAFSTTVVRANAPVYGASNASAAFTVARRDLTVTAPPHSWTYGDATAPAANITPTGAAGIQSQCGDAGTAVATTDRNGASDAGSYDDAINARIDFTPASTASNYEVEEVKGDLTILPRPINLNIVQPVSRQYGDPNTAALTAAHDAAGSGYDATQIRNEDVLIFSLSAPSALPLSAAGSSHSIVVARAGAEGTNIGNYDVTLVPADPQLTITQRILTGAASPGERVYGASNPPFAGTVNNTTLCCGASDGLTVSWESDATPLTNVGEYGPATPEAIHIVLGGAAAANYDASAVTKARLTILQRPLSIAVGNISEQYGQATLQSTLDALAEFQAMTSLVPDDGVAVSVSTTREQFSAVGAYPITASLTGAASINYAFTTTPGTFTVTQRQLTGSIANASKQAGQDNPEFSGEVNGIVDAFEARFITTPVAPATVGSYPITLDLSRPGGSNYSWTGTNGTLSVTPSDAPLTSLSGTWQGTYSWVCTENDPNRSGSADVVFVIGESTNGGLSYPGTASYRGGESAVTVSRHTFATISPSNTGPSSATGTAVRFVIPASPTFFVNNEFAGTISGTTISGQTLNGDSATGENAGCSANSGPSGTFSINLNGGN